MSKKETISRNIRRVRCKKLNRPTVPQNYEDLFDVPENLSQSIDGNEFLRKVSWVDDNDHNLGVFMLFISAFGLHLLSSFDAWGIDGTFSIAPKLFVQVMILSIITPSCKNIPAGFLLLPSKNCYKPAIKSICEAVGSVSHVNKIMVDYEKGLINALSSFLPNAQIHGCLFHFKKAIRRQLGMKGCLLLYNDNESFQEAVNMMMSLFAVPVDHVKIVYEEVIIPYCVAHRNEWERNGYEEETEEFMAYFERSYIGLYK